MQGVSPFAARQRIVAKPAFKLLVKGRTIQQIAKVRTDHALDAVQNIACRTATQRNRPVGINRNSPARPRIIGHIKAAAARKHIRPGRPYQRVVAKPAFQRVATGCTHQHVGKSAADQMFDTCQDIALRIAANPGAAIKVRGNPAARCRIGCRINAAAAINRISARATHDGIVATAAQQRIIARSAQQRIIARAALKPVIAGRTQQHVIVGRTDHPLDAQQRIALGIPAKARARLQIDINRRARCGIIRRVEPGAAVKHICARAAGQRIIASPAHERIGPATAQQLVLARAAFKQFGPRIAGNHVIKR